MKRCLGDIPSPDLFDYPAEPPSVAIATSEEAASAIRPHAATLRRQVFLALVAYDGLTCAEVCDRLALDGNTVRPRLWELEGQGLICRTDERRPTPSGRAANVYRATAKGLEQAA